MRWNAGQTGIAGDLSETRMDAELEETLKDFRLSVHAWSDAAMNRPRRPIHPVVRATWRVAVSWAMGCLLAVCSVGGALYERHHRQEAAKQAAEEARQKQLTAEAASMSAREHNGAASTREEDEQLLAEVDSAVSRQVPSAMEPLAALMEGTGEQ